MSRLVPALLTLLLLAPACAPDSAGAVATPSLDEEAGEASLKRVFTPIKQPDELLDVAGLFTTGGQYVDPGNGVLPDSWSMLARWQGDDLLDHPVSYDLGFATGLHVPEPRTQWQRGQQPEHPDGTPGVQLHGYRAGMLINTWTVPHRYIEGGGYNDMFGYAFSPANRPRAFVGTGGPSHLVLQASLAVPWFGAWRLEGGSWVASAYPASLDGDGQLALFAYLEDVTRPDLHPIALVALAWGNRAGPCGSPGSPGFVGFDYPGGVWFGASGICTTDITTAIYSAPTETMPFADERFFRIHITPDNWRALISRINARGASCAPGQCPASGYSSDPGNYRLQYAGVIQEIVLLENGAPKNDSQIRQVSMSARVSGVGLYRYR